MEPRILYLILCNDVRPDPKDLHRLNIFGLLLSIRSRATPPFPAVRSLFSVLVILTGGQGSGELRVRVVQDQTGRTIFSTRPRLVRFLGDPAEVLGMRFSIQNCSFPEAGLYWVEVVYEGRALARQQLALKP